MFPLHICERIVSHIHPHHRRRDLYALLFTDKSFRAAAEPAFYSQNIFTDVKHIHLFTQTLTKLNPKLALHVRTFGINLHDFLYRAASAAAAAASNSVYQAALVQVTQQGFWDDVRAALCLMEGLKTLVLVQMTGLKIAHWTRMLDCSTSGSVTRLEFPFALEEVKLHLGFDDCLVRFLNAQAGRLRVVQLYNTASSSSEEDDGEEGGEELVLPHVDTLDISISIARYIRPNSLTRLTHLQLFFGPPSPSSSSSSSSSLPPSSLSTSQLLTILSNLIIHPSRLRGLSLLELPHRLSTIQLCQHIIKLTNGTLLHLSHLHLPAPYPANVILKSQFLGCLIELPRLISIELVLDSWDPSPPSSSIGSTTTTTAATTTTTPVGPGMPPPLHTTQTTTTTASQTDTSLPSNYTNPQLQVQQQQLPTPASQKALISELRTYCPTLRTVVFWCGKARMRWAFVVDGVPFQQPITTMTTTTATTNTTTTAIGSGGGGSIDLNNTAAASGACEMTSSSSSSSICRIENAALSGEWHYRMEQSQWPGHSRLWYSC